MDFNAIMQAVSAVGSPCTIPWPTLPAPSILGWLSTDFFGIFLAYFGRELYNKANLET